MSRNFSRHLQRNHGEDNEVKAIFGDKTITTEQRRNLIALVRNQGQLDPALNGLVLPKKRDLQQTTPVTKEECRMCQYCFAWFRKNSFGRHLQGCFAKPHPAKPSVTENLIYSASLQSYGKYISKLSVNEFIFKKMKADERTETAVSDFLIAMYGETLLKQRKKKRNLSVVHNKIRECARILLRARILDSKVTDMLSLMKAEYYSVCVQAVQIEAKFNPEHDSYGAGSLALHFGTTLTDLAALGRRLFLEKKIPPLRMRNLTEKDFTDFEFIVKAHYHKEVGSVANKDLLEKKSMKPTLLPLTEDIMKLKKYVEEEAQAAYRKLKQKVTKGQYRILLETTLVALTMHNRKRSGDVHYMDIEDYNKQINQKSNHEMNEFSEALTESEKVLTKNYKRIISIGKLSRPCVVLIPKYLRKYCDLIFSIRKANAWNNNCYFFSYPHSTKWIMGSTVVRKYALNCGARRPELLTFTKLRKHIATMTQVLNLQEHEIDQLARFLGHTTKTHKEFYK